MGPRFDVRRCEMNRTIAPIIALALAGAFFLPGVGLGAITGHFTPAAPSARSTGAAAVADARASLALGLGPAVSHPAGLPSSPGGYGWANATSAVGVAPSGRLATLAWDPSDGYVLLFGFETISGFVRDTWTYANGNWTNITGEVGTSPPVENQGALAYDPSSGLMVLYIPGYNATWTYHAKVWTNVTATAGHPTELLLPSFVTDTSDNEALLFGGQAVWGPTFQSVTWSYKNGTWTNISATSPFNFGRIILPFGADDPTDHGIVVLGLSEWKNTTPYLYRPATFVFSHGVWTNLTPTLPVEPAMSEAFNFVWLPSIGADVMQASVVVNSTGSLGSPAGITWEFSHGLWTNVTGVTGPQPDNGILGGCAADPVDNTIILFGGDRITAVYPLYPATWLFSAAPTVTASISKPVIDAGQSVTLTGTVANGASPLTSRWNFGDGTNASALSGAHTYSKTGVVTATFTVTDLVGHSVSATASVYVNPAPSVTASATPTSPVNGTWVAFGAQVTGGTAPFAYAWTFGDGGTGTTATTAHSYSKAGTYPVNVTVTDAVGVVKSTTLSVTVTAATPVTSPATSTSSTSVSLTSGTGLYLLIGILVLLAVVVLLAVLLMRRPKSPPGTLQPYPAAPAGASPGGASPPPGAGGPPS